jgi:hypothetical protein
MTDDIETIDPVIDTGRWGPEMREEIRQLRAEFLAVTSRILAEQCKTNAILEADTHRDLLRTLWDRFWHAAEIFRKDGDRAIKGK